MGGQVTSVDGKAMLAVRDKKTRYAASKMKEGG